MIFFAPFKTTSLKLITGGALALMMAVPAFAIGGNDPIPGIDIIVKENPGSQPIQPGGFNSKDIGLPYNAGAEKLSGALYRLLEQTMRANAMKNTAPKEQIFDAAKDLSQQVKEGSAGMSRFSFPSADGRSKMTVTFKIYGEMQARKTMAMDADTYGTTRSNRSTGEGIAAPQGCVTVSGAVDANCDGLADRAVKAKRGK